MGFALPDLKLILRVLVFRENSEELRTLNLRHLLLGLTCTWIVGVGRWWEDPRAGIVQKLGLGSIAYVFFLSGFLWLLLWPLGPANWTLRRLLTLSR